jgi:hypothetical protein
MANVYLLTTSHAADGNDQTNHATVGFPITIEGQVIAGSEVRPKLIDDRAQPIIIRIVATYPHGTDFRYDLEFYGLEPGEFDLADFLQRIDTADQQLIAKIPVVIESLLPEGQVEPSQLKAVSSRFASYYKWMLILGGVFWIAGLLAILLVGRERKKRAIAAEEPPTIADQLRPLLEAAISGDISSEQAAELERLLANHWTDKMQWENLSAAETRQKMRDHPEASVLLNQIDHWLHQPKSEAGPTDVDIATVLQPYLEE